MGTPGIQRFSGSSFQMGGIYNVVMSPLSTSSTTLTCSWSSTASYAVTLQFYQSATNSTTGGTLLGASQSVSAGTTSFTFTPSSIADGSYYYVVATRQSNNIVTSNAVVM